MTFETKATPQTQPQPATPAILTRIEGEMDKLFDTLQPRRWLRPFSFEWLSLGEMLPFTRVPKVDVIDREDEVVLRAEIPGVHKDDIQISVGEDSVTIKGSAREEKKEDKGDYFRHELAHGSFRRTVGLPANVDYARARAKFKEGVLELILPKIEGAARHNVKVE